MNLFVDILYNFGVLAAFSIISGFVLQKVKHRLSCAIVQGFIFGFATLIGMIKPVVVQQGLIFDGRSVMLSIVGLFFGPIAATISATMAIILRVAQGGVGMPMGVLAILESAVIGTFFHYRWYLKEKKLGLVYLLALGFLVHIIMILCALTLPSDIRYTTISAISFTVLTIYPAATVLIGSVLLEAVQHDKNQKELIKRDEQLRTINVSLTDGMVYQIVTDKEGKGQFTFVSDSVKQLYGVTPCQVYLNAALIYDKVLEEDRAFLKEREREGSFSINQ